MFGGCATGAAGSLLRCRLFERAGAEVRRFVVVVSVVTLGVGVLSACTAPESSSDATSTETSSAESASTESEPDLAQMSDFDAAVFIMRRAWPEDPPPDPNMEGRDLTEEQSTVSLYCYALLKGDESRDSALQQWRATTRSDLDPDGRLAEVPSKKLDRAARQVFDEKCPAYFEEQWESPW